MTNYRHRPTPWDEAKNFWYWTDNNPLAKPATSGATYIPRDQTENGETRIDLDTDLAWQNRRFFGFVADFKESPSDNTATPYRVTLVGRIAMLEFGMDDPEWHWVKVQAFSSNLLVTAPIALLLGDMVTGIFAATYGGFMTAALESWRPTTRDEWESISPLNFPDHIHDFDFSEITVSGIPSLGGSGFYYPGEARLAGVRLAAPPKDPHTYHREMRAIREAAAKGLTVTFDTDKKEEKRKASQKRREDRSKSCSRYEKASPSRGRPENRTVYRR